MMLNLSKYKYVLDTANLIKYSGKVSRIVGLTIESLGPAVKLGELCYIYPLKGNECIKAEAVGFKDTKVLLMPLGEMNGIGPGSKVVASGDTLNVNVGEE